MSRYGGALQVIPWPEYIQDETTSLFNSFYTKWTSWLLATLGAAQPAQDGMVIHALEFILKRVIKLVPIYYISIVMAITTKHILGIHFGKKTTRQQWVLTVLLLTSWTYPAKRPGGAAWMWTLSTMVFFYVAFPALAPWIQSMDDDKLYLVTVHSYVTQAFTMLSLSALALYHTDLQYWLFALDFPPFQLLLFVMGCCAGMHHVRHCSDDEQALLSNDGDLTRAATVTDQLAALIVGSLAIFILLGNSSDKELAPSFRVSRLVSGSLLAALMPLVTFHFVRSATCHSEQAISVQFLSHPALQLLGTTSLSLYATHFIVLFFLLGKEWRRRERNVLLFIESVALSILFALCFYLMVEKPVARFVHFICNY